jgi:hypothetical protein
MALPYQRESVFTHPPHLIVEIPSPDDEPAEMLEKIADYLKFGVPHIWIPRPVSPPPSGSRPRRTARPAGSDCRDRLDLPSGYLPDYLRSWTTRANE